MITEYLFLSPGGEIICNLQEIRRYAEEHYQDRRRCPPGPPASSSAYTAAPTASALLRSRPSASGPSGSVIQRSLVPFQLFANFLAPHSHDHWNEPRRHIRLIA